MRVNKLILLLPLLAAPVIAQPAAANQSNAQPNPMSTWLRDAFTRNRNTIMRLAEKMPEENYGMRPGTQTEVRTFGQQVTHLATYNFLWCSQSKGEKNPNPGSLDKLTSKADILKVLNDAFSYCDSAYSGLTDASGAEMIDITQENGRQTRNLRLGLLILNYGHNNEIYGSMVVYLRMKDIVPPASEPRPQQKK
jgi:uncharacterized damage-inducible protein DinB